MKKLLINGGVPLHGDIEISGAKNAALPLMVSAILCSQKLTLTNIPQVSDIATMANLLINLGLNISLDGYDEELGNQGKVMILDGANINNPIADYDLVRKMRASIFVLGPLLARCGRAKVSLPGGCAIGTRPVDLHLKALETLGASFELKDGYIEGVVKNQRLKGAEISFEKISVGATENAMMASSLAIGETVINNAACEPEIVDLAKCLNGMGAKIYGAGTSKIIIQGVDNLYSYRHRIIADRIEAGTYAIASGITKGKIRLHGIDISTLIGFKNELEQAGIIFTEISKNIIEVSNSNKIIKPVNISTNPFPGFPTDLQAQFMALMTLSNGEAIIEENIFENRFMHVLELARMNANINSHGKIAIVKGVNNLKGAEVMATDLRASVSLVLAGLAAEGQTIINRLYHLERGYERLVEKLINCGADIKIIY